VPEFEFEVEVNKDFEHLAELCLMYWATNDDGSFTHTVKALAELFHLPSYKISKIVTEASIARSTTRRCKDCQEGFIYKSRSDWTSAVRFTPNRCRTCVETEQRRQREQQEQTDAAMKAAILRRYPIVTDGPMPRAENLNLVAAFALAALLEDAEEISQGISIPVADRTDRLTPRPDYDFELLSMLANSKLVRVDPSSTTDAFVWNEDGTLSDSYYPVLASYHLPGAGTPGSKVEEYLQSFNRVVSRETWPDHWVDQFSELWFNIAVSECKAYLVHMLQLHGLDFTPGQKTEDVFRRALKWYSIGQMYYFIWRAARDSAAYFARDHISAKQAANSAVTRISADVDRAYEQGWQVSTYRRDSRLPPSTLSHILFSRALKLDDPMAYSPVELPARRAGLELAWQNIDSASFERLIFQLLVETEGYENVEWLMHTNAPDHGRDVSAVRLRRDPLSGHSSQRVAVQCKHWLTRPVRDTDVSSAIVSISHCQDRPFEVLVIATSGRFTSDAVAWIERHNSRGERPSVEIWNDARLEFLLSERLHLVRAYELR